MTILVIVVAVVTITVVVAVVATAVIVVIHMTKQWQHIKLSEQIGATRGVTVSTSAFLACHQCYCAGSSLAWGLNLRALVCGIC